MTIKVAETREDFLKCFEVVQFLRPHLTIESYLGLIEKMTAGSYSLIYAEKEGRALSACGFRHLTTLYDGEIIYIDDLSTHPEARGKGYAGSLLDFVFEKARKESITAVHLDSGHARHDAHRLYLNKKMNIVYHHFRIAL